jgi:hypothetical protein
MRLFLLKTAVITWIVCLLSISRGVWAMDIQFNLQEKESVFTIAPTILCECDTQVSFDLNVVKSSSGNISKSRQSGKAHLKPQIVKALSQTTFNFSEHDHYEMHLMVKTLDGEIMFDQTLIYPPQ